MSNAALWATSTASAAKRWNAGSTMANGGLSRTISSVMPWKRIEASGIGRPGLTTRSNVSVVRMRPFTMRTPAIDTTSSPSAGLSPVVSRSKTT